MHSIIVATILCNALLFFTITKVFSQPQTQPSLPSPEDRRLSRAIAQHGSHQHHQRLPRNAMEIPNSNLKPTINQNQNYQSVNKNPTKVMQNQASDPTNRASSQNGMVVPIAKPNPNPISNQNQTLGESQNLPLKENNLDTHDEENNKNPGKLFGWTPKNGIMASDSKALLADEFLHAHNWVRNKYNLPPYTWDENLESVARKYLMERYDDCRVIHSKYGYEKDWYDFNKLTCTPPPPSKPNRPPKMCGHFTQIVWRDSLRVGCGLQHCNDRNAGMLIACEYDPPGNYANENPLEQHI
ncbi:hypothetical protein AAHE18_02G084000 [Arachis hypogaea]